LKFNHFVVVWGALIPIPPVAPVAIHIQPRCGCVGGIDSYSTGCTGGYSYSTTLWLKINSIDSMMNIAGNFDLRVI
jgi:hypothetical protein